MTSTPLRREVRRIPTISSGDGDLVLKGESFTGKPKVTVKGAEE